MAGSVAHARTAAASAGVTNDPPLLFCLPATNRSTRSEPAQSVEVRTPRAVRIRAAVGTWQTATLETEFCGQRLSSARAAHKPQRRWNGLGRPTNAAASRGNVVPFCGLGNHVDLRGLLGGAEGNRTPDLCSAIAALSRLIQSFLRLSLIATLPVSRPHAASGEGHFDNQRAGIAEFKAVRSHLQQHYGAGNVAVQRCVDMVFDRQFQP
jgi:hypothetical protein